MVHATKPLTLLKAYRIANNLDTNKICIKADISRPYLTRLEQGATCSPDIAERLVKVLIDAECTRQAERSGNPLKVEMLESAKRLIELTKAQDAEFSKFGIREIHLLYPERYALCIEARAI